MISEVNSKLNLEWLSESTKELLRLPLTTTQGERQSQFMRDFGQGLKTNLPSSSTVENLHSYSLMLVMTLSDTQFF